MLFLYPWKNAYALQYLRKIKWKSTELIYEPETASRSSMETRIRPLQD